MLMVTRSLEQPRTVRLLPRGNWMDETGPVVEPAIPGFLGRLATVGRANRADLANWLVRPVADGGRGYSCLAEIRMVETILNGKPSTPFMRFGDRVGIEMHDDDGASIFGRIDQLVEDSNG